MNVTIINAAAGTDINAGYIARTLQEKCPECTRFDICSLEFDPTYPIRKNDGGFDEKLVEDDLREPMRAVFEADLVILLSPNYFNFISGYAKLFLDKFFVYYNQKNMPAFDKEKKFFFILTQASPNRSDGQWAQDWMKSFTERFRMKFFGMTIPSCSGREPDGAKLKMDEITMSLNMFKG